MKMNGTNMTHAEWLDTAELRRTLSRELGVLRWSGMTIDECDAAVRDANARGVTAAVDAIVGRVPALKEIL